MYKEHWDAATTTKSWIDPSRRKTLMVSPLDEHALENLHLHLIPFLRGVI